MNLIQNFFQFSFYRFFIAGLVFILSAAAFQNYFLFRKNPDQVTKYFSQTLIKKENELNEILKAVVKEDRKTKNPFNLLKIYDFYKLDDDKGLSVFKYHNDTLVFWSTNSTFLPRKLLQKPETSKTWVQLKNGLYESIQITDSVNAYVGLLRVKNQYPFENDYLRNTFQKDFQIPYGTKLVFNKNAHIQPGESAELKFKFILPAKTKFEDIEILLLFSLFTIGFLLIIVSLYHLYCEISFFKMRRWILLLSFIFDVLLLRFIQFSFRFPRSIYDSVMFGPTWYSSSAFLPSPGDFLINSLIGLIIAYVIFQNMPASVLLIKKSSLLKATIVTGSVTFLIAGFCFCMYVIQTLVTNSTIPLTLQNITVLNYLSLIAFIIIASVILGYLLLAHRAVILLFSIPEINRLLPINNGSKAKFSATSFVLSLLFMSIAATIVFNHFNEKTEREKRALLAVKLSLERDPLAEMLFSATQSALLRDTVLTSFYKENSPRPAGFTEDSLSLYLSSRYFGELWSNYNVQVTLCAGKKLLRIQPRNYLVDCESYFSDIVQDFGKPINDGPLYYLDYGFGFRNYLAILTTGVNDSASITRTKVYIEFSSKSGYRSQGYPELLIDRKDVIASNLTDYSYAFYRNGKLMNRVGNIHYSLDLDHTVQHRDDDAHFYIDDGVDTYCYPIDKDNVLVISKKEYSFLNRIAPFSYLFIFLGFFTLLFFIIVRPPFKFSLSRLKFSERLQISMIGLLITSLLIIGFLVIYYLTLLNHDKNAENLSDRAHSMLIELQHKLGAEDNLETDKSDDLNELLVKFSNVFFCDVNLYDPKGRLISTSRPQIFETGLISTRLNAIAFYNLREVHSSLYIHDETIGKHQYSSAYIPFFNDRNQLLGYLNLPYFAKQEELKREISTFLVAFINVYAFLIIIGIFIAFLVSNYITRPLRLLTFGLGNLTLGKSNEKLEWQHDDEVGKLVAEYNRKLDELAKSAEVFAKSERESAWREMARQIAHEIKNPLTPMKLSVQYLQKSWDEHAGDWDRRLKKFTETMIEQIDSLAFIATAFSDFSTIPDSRKERLDLNEIIRNALSLYDNKISADFNFLPEKEHHYIYADKKQIMRVLTNLFNNSIQALEGNDQGYIEVKVSTFGINQCIAIKDNGAGILPEQAEKIFEPYFTTKTGGMGLGLAIVKNIIDSSDGEISFSSVPGKETVFTIYLPALE